MSTDPTNEYTEAADYLSAIAKSDHCRHASERLAAVAALLRKVGPLVEAENLLLIIWALGIAVEWETESIDCQTSTYTGKSLDGFAGFNKESAKRIGRCRKLQQALAASATPQPQEERKSS